MSQMIGFCPLASGSKGNCVYLGTPQLKLLIDAGLSARATKEKLAEIGVDFRELDAILITHEHSDHIQGLKVLALKMGIPVFANHETAKGIVEQLHECPKFKIFSTGESFEFGDLEIHPFNIQHDTLDPVAFTLKLDGLKLGFCTDLGFVSTLVLHQLQACDYLYVEANHQPSMVHASSRPMVYKQRVLSRNGHLSNEACAELLSKVAHPNLKHVYLAHLSSECNTPETALGVVKDKLQSYGITLEMCVAPQAMVSQPIYF
ncbi:putative metallo-hydrolase YycJ [Neochlamydia sp. AcF65]|uniref:MBL fold metallo-hydrolase n=2 Tax=Neochlamydia TaxID=112987 RepID=UPI001BD8986B|nr:MBL fold metallo-hydrolase [Neochlamydia sp. AcF65]MBS4166230.1 putative metallo-hydrolase YycJ [Neochlamydia sp. AcF65]MBS4170369.1 putative metallo-hydrolase YycJ [Neochlamydia sp. AcF95]